MSAPKEPSKQPARPKPPAPPLWRQAFDVAERAVTPRAEELVRTPSFSVGAALVRRAQGAARNTARGLSARVWHLVNLPAGSDVDRLRTQIGSLDREVRRLTLQLEAERRHSAATTSPATSPATTENTDASRPEPADDPRPRPARRRAQRPARP
jgi:hypothetical protein